MVTTNMTDRGQRSGLRCRERRGREVYGSSNGTVVTMRSLIIDDFNARSTLQENQGSSKEEIISAILGIRVLLFPRRRTLCMLDPCARLSIPCLQVDRRSLSTLLSPSKRSKAVASEAVKAVSAPCPHHSILSDIGIASHPLKPGAEGAQSVLRNIVA